MAQSSQSHPHFAMADLTSLAFSADAEADVAALLESDGEESKDGSQVPPKGGKGKKGKGRRKTSKGAGKSTPSPNKNKAEDGYKKCKMCNKWKELDEFYEDQARCKGCHNDTRSLQRIAKNQQASVDLKKMETEEPKMYSALLKSFAKERDTAKKAGEKLKFSVTQFKISYQSREGVQAAGLGEMMWEGEYKEFAKTAKAGYLSDAEATANWNAWLADPDHPRDRDGPRNYLRLLIKVKDQVKNFQEAARQKELTKEEKLGKNASQATLDTRLGFVYGQHGLETHEVGDGQSMKRKATQQLVLGKDGGDDIAVLSSDGLLAPDVTDLLGNVTEKLRRPPLFCLFYFFWSFLALIFHLFGKPCQEKT